MLHNTQTVCRKMHICAAEQCLVRGVSQSSLPAQVHAPDANMVLWLSCVVFSTTTTTTTTTPCWKQRCVIQQNQPHIPYPHVIQQRRPRYVSITTPCTLATLSSPNCELRWEHGQIIHPPHCQTNIPLTPQEVHRPRLTGQCKGEYTQLLRQIPPFRNHPKTDSKHTSRSIPPFSFPSPP